MEEELKNLRVAGEEDQQQKGRDAFGRKHSQEQFNSFSDGVDMDELLELRQRLEEREKEVQQLKSMVRHQHANGGTMVRRVRIVSFFGQ